MFRTVYVPMDLVPEVKAWVAEHRKLKSLIRKVTAKSLGIIRNHTARRRAAARAPASGTGSSAARSERGRDGAHLLRRCHGKQESLQPDADRVHAVDAFPPRPVQADLRLGRDMAAGRGMRTIPDALDSKVTAGLNGRRGLGRSGPGSFGIAGTHPSGLHPKGVLW